MILEDVIKDHASYKMRANMRSTVKRKVLLNLQSRVGGCDMQWYENNRKLVSRMIEDACDKYPIPTKAEQELQNIADTVLLQIDARISWDALEVI